MLSIFSRDSRGNEFNFFADYYRTTREVPSNIFRKGYQWPFYARQMLEFDSSLFDTVTRPGKRLPAMKQGRNGIRPLSTP